ncbi:MAG: SDR family oxidoreductase, partial [Actinobacteria bacterium]|nr:SDR family oxidoreductase [Actinomycetota bacterium]
QFGPRLIESCGSSSRTGGDNAMLLASKTAIITGGAAERGIGLATARLFAEHGARTALLDIDGEGAEAAAGGIGPEHRGYVCDVTDAARCRQVAD